MKRTFLTAQTLFLTVLLLCCAAFGFAQDADTSSNGAGTTTAAPTSGIAPTSGVAGEAQNAPESIVNNQYYLKSVMATKQAKDAYDQGDYDLSAQYAEQASEYAKLSDNYVAQRLADNAIFRAHSRYTWAGSVGAATRYPDEYKTATTAYNEALDARKAEQWDPAIDAANRCIAALANVSDSSGAKGPASGSQPPRPAQGTLPAQYTVRQWSKTGDCFSTIAGWSWVYGDKTKWRTLYEANKDKLPNPDNPHLIKPGMVIDIPSINGEVRSGMWDPEAKY